MKINLIKLCCVWGYFLIFHPSTAQDILWQDKIVMSKEPVIKVNEMSKGEHIVLETDCEGKSNPGLKDDPPSALIYSSMYAPSNSISNEGQSGSRKRTLYRCVVHYSNGSKVKGVLYVLDDSMIQLMDIHRAKVGQTEGLILHSIEVDQIKLMKFRRTGAIGSGALGGGGMGIFIGGAIGYATYTPCINCWIDFGSGYSTASGALLGAAIGVGLGTLMGSINKKFRISGNHSLYEQKKADLEKYLYPTIQDYTTNLR
jgi:hypothetical protein